MKVVIPGGSGQVGAILARAFAARGDDVVALSRNPLAAPWRVVEWDARTPAGWQAEVDGADVIINLAGRSVNCRYTEANRRAMMASRVDSTRAVGAAIAAARRPPRLWLQASTATIYAHRFDAGNDETNGVIGGGEAGAPPSWAFSVAIARAWEQALAEAPVTGTRRVALRTSMVMSPDRGGIFDTLLRLVRFGLGGTAADGRQFISWIHDRDFVRAIDWLIEHDEISGAVNVTSPAPLPNAAFMRDLRQAWGAPIGLPAFRWMLPAGAWLMGSETELVLKSRRVVPRRLLDGGFTFDYPSWPEAAADLCHRWRH